MNTYEKLEQFVKDSPEVMWKPVLELIDGLLQGKIEDLDSCWQDTKDRETIVRQQSEKITYIELQNSLLNLFPSPEEVPEVDKTESG
jgi:hypothetical protein